MRDKILLLVKDNNRKQHFNNGIFKHHSGAECIEQIWKNTCFEYISFFRIIYWYRVLDCGCYFSMYLGGWTCYDEKVRLIPNENGRDHMKCVRKDLVEDMLRTIKAIRNIISHSLKN